MNDMVIKAFEIAYKAHQNQFDKAGKPYITHPLFVASQMSSDEQIATALLHDVVEDTDITLDDLRDSKISEDVIEAVSLLTHDEEVDYFEYINKLKNNETARKVKLADLTHNMDINRIKGISEKDYQRLEKYKKAREILLKEEKI